jgi:hypothetical protein
MRKIQNHPILSRLVPWIPFWVLFAWGWRVRNPFTHIPAYGDVLEVLWGIEWYHRSILIQHTSPLFTPLVFHPLGWHTATLAYTPVLFLLALPIRELGGLAFAYNVLAVLALVVAFAGAFRLARLFLSWEMASIAALVFTFWRMCWEWVGGHLNMTWISGLLPWMAYGIERAKQSERHAQWRWVAVTGLMWGIMVNFALYGIFIGALAFLLWGREIFRAHRLRQILVAALIALAIGLPTIAPYYVGSRQDQTHIYGAEHNMWWGASLNSLFIPSVFHPLPPLRLFSHKLYGGPYNESGVMNFGMLLSLLAALGAVIAIRSKPSDGGLVILTLTGIVLSMGPLLRWNGEVVRWPVLDPLNAALWHLGHALKPAIFSASRPPSFEAGVPLPGFLLTVIVPFYEAARTVSRYAILGMIGVTILAGLLLERLPKLARITLIVILLIELWPSPTQNLPLPLHPHPAYAWLAEQRLEPGEGIVDLVYPTLQINGHILWATFLHGKPTASGGGSSWPEHTFALWNYFITDSQALGRPEVGVVFRQYKIRYVFLHMGAKEKQLWSMIQSNSAFRPIQCFDPLPGPTPWPYPICVAEVLDTQGPINLMPQEGWSGTEDWGVWSEGLRSQAGWMSPARQDYRLRIGAFPLCVPDRRQEMVVKVNGQEMAHYRWQECELWESEILIPPSMVRIGWNEVSFEYAYALSPAEVTRGQNGDRRMLSVGFTRLEVTR